MIKLIFIPPNCTSKLQVDEWATAIIQEKVENNVEMPGLTSSDIKLSTLNHYLSAGCMKHGKIRQENGI